MTSARRRLLFLALLTCATAALWFQRTGPDTEGDVTDLVVDALLGATAPSAPPDHIAKIQRAPGASRTPDAATRPLVAARAAHAYRTDQLMVRPVAGADLAAIAADHGARWATAPRRSGLGALSVPAGNTRDELAARLAADPRIADVAPMGVTRGAGGPSYPPSLMPPEAAANLAGAEQAYDTALQAYTAAADAEAAAWATYWDALATWEDAKDADEPDAVVDALKADKDAAKRVAEDAGDLVEDLYKALEQAEDALVFAEGGIVQADRNRTRALRDLQWFLKQSRHPRWKLNFADALDYVEPDYSPWIVAVLDTGVAYEDHTDERGSYAAAPSFADAAFVAPYDFVHDDTHANDDHQHGTHIASIIASAGDMRGIAPDTTIMPIKVLDADNSGTEVDLIDGIYHAVDHGADILNMSLSFDVGYIPSDALLEALQYAHDQGAVLIAAAGNNAADAVTWPAQFRHAIAVGAATKTAKSTELRGASYSNASTRVDITGAGGAYQEDFDADGFDDGVLAETFALNQPTEFGFFLYAGTSQAAAVASGSAVVLLQAGAEPWQIRKALQFKAIDDVADDPYMAGFGAGTIDLFNSVAAITKGESKLQTDPTYHAVVLPYVTRKDADTIIPQAAFGVIDDDGVPIGGAEVMGMVYTQTEAHAFSCETRSFGYCRVMLDEIDVPLVDGVPQDPASAWLWRVDTIVKDSMSQHPGGMLYATDGLELLLTAAQDHPELDGGLLSVRWAEGHETLVGTMADTYAVVNAGTGLASVPLGITFTPRAVQEFATVQEYEVDLDGTGLGSIPLGTTRMWRIEFDGSGLGSIPLGLQGLRFTALDGTGLGATPLGFHAFHLIAPMQLTGTDGTGLGSIPLGFTSNPISLVNGRFFGVDPSGTLLGTKIASGGWTVAEGEPGATLVTVAGLLGVLLPEDTASGDGGGDAAQLDEALIPAYCDEQY